MKRDIKLKENATKRHELLFYLASSSFGLSRSRFELATEDDACGVFHQLLSTPLLIADTKKEYTFINHSYIAKTVRVLRRINFVVVHSFGWDGASQGVASIFAVPCRIEYRNRFKYDSFVVFVLLLPFGTCCHELSRNLVLLIHR